MPALPHYTPTDTFRTRAAWLAAAPGRITNVDIVGGDHYLAGRVDLQERVADEIAAFAEAL